MYLSVSRRFQLRLVSAVMIVSAAILLLFGLYQKNAQATKVITSHHALNVLIPTLIITTTHLIYLLIVNYVTLIARPVQRMGDSIDYVFPALLSTCYILSALSYLLTLDPTLVVFKFALSQAFAFAAFIIFGILYLLWGLHDWRRVGATTVMSRKVELGFWIFIDIFFGLLSIYYALSVISVLPEMYMFPYMDARDMAVVVSVATFTLFRFAFRFLQKLFSYRDIFSQFLERINVSKFCRLNASAIDSLVAQLVSWTQDDAGSNRIRFLDYGCANGKRGVEFLRLLKKYRSQLTFEVCGVDSDPGWGRFFEAYLAHVNEAESYTFYTRREFNRLKGDIARFDVLYFSHFLYGEREYRDFRAIVKLARNDAIIIVRGFGPKSIFWVASSVKAASLITPSQQALWIEKYIKHICKDCLLARLDRSMSPESVQPDLTVGQEIALSSENDVRALSDIIEFLYGPSARECVEVYVQDVKSAIDGKDVVTIPSEDIIFLYTHEHRPR